MFFFPQWKILRYGMKRDISHSSVERIICPETLILTDFAIHRMTDVIKNLVVNRENMLENLKKTRGLFNSQRVLLKLVEKGLTRESAYKLYSHLQ